MRVITMHELGVGALCALGVLVRVIMGFGVLCALGVIVGAQVRRTREQGAARREPGGAEAAHAGAGSPVRGDGLRELEEVTVS